MIATLIFLGLLILLLSMLRRKIKTSMVIFFIVFGAMIFLFKHHVTDHLNLSF